MVEQYATNAYSIFRLPIFWLSFDRHLDCCHLLPIVNNSTMNTGVQVFVWASVFNSWNVYIGVEFLSHMAVLCQI